MTYFRCYFFNKQGRIIGFSEMECRSADEARATAAKLCDDYSSRVCAKWELWTGDKRVETGVHSDAPANDHPSS